MELSLPVWLGSSLGTRTHLASTHLERECSLQAICSPGALYVLGTQDLDGRLATKLISSNSSPNMKQGAEMEDHATRHRQSTIAELSPAMPSTKGQSEKQAGHSSLLTQRQEFDTGHKFYQHRFTFHGRENHEPRLSGVLDEKAFHRHVTWRPEVTFYAQGVGEGEGDGTMLMTSNLSHPHETVSQYFR